MHFVHSAIFWPTLQTPVTMFVAELAVSEHLVAAFVDRLVGVLLQQTGIMTYRNYHLCLF